MSVSAGGCGSMRWHWWIKPNHPFAPPCFPLSSPRWALLTHCLLWLLGHRRCCSADSLTPLHFCMTQQNRPRRFLYNATDRHKQMLQTDVIKHRCDLKSPRRALGSSQTVQSTDWRQAGNAARGSPFPPADAGWAERDRYGRYEHAPAAGGHLGAARLQEGQSSPSSAFPFPVLDALLSLENLVVEDFVKVSCFHYQNLPKQPGLPKRLYPKRPRLFPFSRWWVARGG